MASFNLVDEPWVPCTARDGPTLLSLRETLLRAHELVEVSDASPLVTISLHRLLLAIVHRVFGPATEEEWNALWQRGRFVAEPLVAYLERWQGRFDLFDEQYPFYQTAQINVGADQLDAYKLVPEASKSNARLFSHVDLENPPWLTPGEAARALVSHPNFHPSGTVGKLAGTGPITARAGALAGSVICLLTGTSLFETLILNTVQYDGVHFPFPAQSGDVPIWERDTVADDEQRPPDGYLEWLTWPGRWIRLAPDERGGRLLVRRARIARGRGLPTGETPHRYEQMVGYRATKDAKPGDDPYRSVSLRRDRAVWRDSAVLFQATDASVAPRTLRAIAQRVMSGYLEERTIYPLQVFGIAYDQANIQFWRTERLPLPLVYLQDETVWGYLVNSLALAEDASWAVRMAAKILAAHVLNLDLKAQLKKVQSDALTARHSAMGAERRYWARLDPLFARYLIDGATEPGRAQALWGKAVMRAARSALEEVSDGLGTGGQNLRVEVQARWELERLLARAEKEHPYRTERAEEAS